MVAVNYGLKAANSIMHFMMLRFYAQFSDDGLVML
jgi:hypothetical protein